MLYRILSVRRNPLHPAAIHRILRDPGVCSEHPDGDHVLGVVLDQHGERPGSRQSRPSHCRHGRLPDD